MIQRLYNLLQAAAVYILLRLAVIIMGKDGQ